MRKYLDFDSKRGFRSKRNLYYECTICGALVSSQPKVAANCSCSNIRIDAEARRMSVKDESNIRLVQLDLWEMVKRHLGLLRSHP